MDSQKPMKPMTFDEWKKANADLKEVKVGCGVCRGTGEDYRFQHSQVCQNCSGSGEYVETSLYDMYRDQLAKDSRLVKKVLGVVMEVGN